MTKYDYAISSPLQRPKIGVINSMDMAMQSVATGLESNVDRCIVPNSDRNSEISAK